MIFHSGLRPLADTLASTEIQVLYRALGEQPPGGPFSFAALLTNQTGAGEEDCEEEEDEEWRQWEGSVTLGAAPSEQEPPPQGEALVAPGPTPAEAGTSAEGPKEDEPSSATVEPMPIAGPVPWTGNQEVDVDGSLRHPIGEGAAHPATHLPLEDAEAEAGVEPNASPISAAAAGRSVNMTSPLPEGSAFIRISMEPAGPQGEQSHGSLEREGRVVEERDKGIAAAAGTVEGLQQQTRATEDDG